MQQTRHVPSDLRDLRESCLASGLEPSLEQLLAILRIMFRLDENETFLVLDGLEAINTNMLKMIVQIIVDAVVQGSRVRLLATSRINSSVEHAIKFGPQDYHVNGFNWHNDPRGRNWHNRCKLYIIPRNRTDEDILLFLPSDFSTMFKIDEADEIDEIDVSRLEPKGM